MAELKEMGLSWGEAQASAKDRTLWRSIVVALCPTGDRIDVSELMARSYVKSCKHFHVHRCAQMCFNKKYYQTEIILQSNTLVSDCQILHA